MMVVEEPMLQCPSESAQLGSKPISISITVTRQREKGDVGEEATAQPTKDQHRVSSRAAAARRAAWNSCAPRCCRCAWSKHFVRFSLAFRPVIFRHRHRRRRFFAPLQFKPNKLECDFRGTSTATPVGQEACFLHVASIITRILAHRHHVRHTSSCCGSHRNRL
jgi:hypothetical protein